MTAARTTLGKLSHATASGREGKARRIEHILARRVGSLASKDVLEIGTGAGVIAARLSAQARSLLSVDVVDERVVTGYRFSIVDSERLPCEDEAFDVVVSNQVIEHVEDGLLHLREIGRVLRFDGLCYLAMPNRFAFVEPHFKLPLLSWLPERARSPYVRLMHRGHRYDVRPLSLGQLSGLVNRAGLRLEDISVEVAEGELRRTIGIGLRPMLKLMHGFFPSYVVLLRRNSR